MLPIISYGVIVYTMNANNEVVYLICRRKHSFGYMDFMKGKYSISNYNQLEILLDEMTIDEKQKAIHLSFHEQWRLLWNYKDISEFENNKYFLKAFHQYQHIQHTVERIIGNSATSWKECEWEFPKGRLNPNESHLDCSLREFTEETGISSDDIHIIHNLQPFQEKFVGSNKKRYIYKYYLAYMSPQTYQSCNLSSYQQHEISQMEWLSLDMCIDKIRPNSLEKVRLLQNIHAIVKEYRLFN
jgi:8-oxo-dGTP pyrophosphatase MutT (NUDIX family)